LIRSHAQYSFGFKSRSCASRIFLQSPLISYFQAVMPPSAPHPRSPSAYVLNLMWQIKFHADMKQKIKLNDRDVK
jgi:prepilin signal peptidase PulO-like enzyme (type II secretory pathway)